MQFQVWKLSDVAVISSLALRHNIEVAHQVFFKSRKVRVLDLSGKSPGNISKHRYANKSASGN